MVTTESKGRVLMRSNASMEECVERGITWLFEHAPSCWIRNMFSPSGEFRAHDSHDNKKECILALAFAHEKDLEDTEGCVTFTTVVQKFKLNFRNTEKLGFSSAGREEATALNEAWKKALFQISFGTRAPRHA